MRESPERYFSVVKAENPEDDREEGAITVYHLNKGMERAEALLAISVAILEVKEWFNVKGNLTDKQVRMLAEMILDYPPFYDLSLGNIKACFHERMMNEKLYDRLDGNIIIGWLKKFKSDMADACYEQRLREEQGMDKGESVESPELEARALDLLKNLPKVNRYRTREEQEEWRRGFLRYKAERMIKKKKDGK